MLSIQKPQTPFQKVSIKGGFTLMEILIVTITLGVIASLAFSNYQKVMEQSYCRNAQTNLAAIQSAAVIYGAKNNTTDDIDSANLTAINTKLKLTISDDQFTYALSGTPASFTAEANRQNGSTNYSCEVKESPSGVTCSNQNFCPDVPDTPT